jgi:hypothetical protein
MNSAKRTNYTIVAVLIGMIILAIAGVIILTNGNTTNANAPKPVSTLKPVQPSTTPAVPKPVTVAQPKTETAQQIADALNCTSFTDEGESGNAGVADSGTCYIDGAKYAIDTFTTKYARDAWLPVAEGYGVVPKWETDTSVTYPSVNS